MSGEIEKFNKLLDEFLEKLVNQFDNFKLRNYRRGFLIIKETNKTVPVNLFMTSCIKFKQQIINKDDEFFFKKSEKIKEYAKNFGNFTDDCGLDKYWYDLNKNTQKAIWDYIQTLFVLGEIIVNKDKELFEKYNDFYLSDYKNEIVNISSANNFSEKFISKLKLNL